MEQGQEHSLFEMNMDSTTQSHIQSISKWTKFISITGFIVAGICLLLFAAYGESMIESFSILLRFGSTQEVSLLIAIVVIALVISGCWLYFLFRASTLLKQGMVSRNSNQLGEGFNAMRIYFILSFIISILGILNTLQSFL
jgi:hypothetical protein